MAKTEIGSILDHPGYAKAKQVYDDLAAKKDRLERELEARLEKGNSASIRKAQLLEDAQNLLAGRDTPAKAPPPPLEEVQRQIDVLKTALDIQAEKVGAQKRAANAMVCQAASPEYRSAVNRLAKALLELKTALKAKAAVLDAIERGGASVVSPIVGIPLRLPDMGAGDVPDFVDQFVTDAREANLL